MKAKLISYSQLPTEEVFGNKWISDATIQDLVAYCARVSNPSNQMNTETSEKLIRYLVKNKHWSPLEMVSVCMEIETTRDIARQLLRHRSFSFQEFCLSGDTEIYFAKPSEYKNGYYAPTSKMKLSELYDKWENGARPIPHRKNPNANIRIPMKDRIRDMLIKCYDEETNRLTVSNIKEVYYTGKKELYEITLSDGKKIKTTKEHKFLSKNGFDTLENIVGLEMINNRATMKNKSLVAVNGIPEYQDKEWLLEKKKESLFVGGGIQYIVDRYGYNYNTIRKWLRLHGLQYTKKESAMTFDVWNKGKFGYNLPPKSEEARKNHRKSAKKGSESNLWRGGGSSKRESIDNIEAWKFREKKNYTCERCNTRGGTLDIHHIIPVSVDPSKQHDVSNWELLCRSCHIDHHKQEDFSGWQSMGAKTKKENSYVVKWVEITSIKYIGEEDTYDIEVDHSSHNYVANGIVVHNSQRYADPTKELEFVTREARLQDEKNRQNSIPTDDEALKQLWDTWQRNVCDQALLAYKWAIENGIAKEQARSVLPEGLTMSRLYVNGTLRSWVHYIELRSANGTQLEHIELAKACAEVISKIFPMIDEYVGKDITKN